ncbi:MAG: PIG-L family deacetylase [Verrucomicrobiales bacterium]|nr:PIG-L family deacetylase [Verrucomicrobiales bacterium]
MKRSLQHRTAFAIAAHPDDIEFVMAGTLLLLKQAGWEIHYLNLSTGNCGSMEFNAAQTRCTRRREAQAAAKLLGAQWHPPFCDDLEILYDLKTLRRLAAVIREVNPGVVLTHSPQDYMEDHMNTSRLAVTAAFVRGMPNFKTVPSRGAVEGDVTIYHAMPHGLCNQLGQPVRPTLFVNTGAVHAQKRQALAAHQSQKAWLDVSQGMDSYLRVMDEMSLAVGKMSRRFQHAEGWRRHAHMGFCAEAAHPLREALERNCECGVDPVS